MINKVNDIILKEETLAVENSMIKVGSGILSNKQIMNLAETSFDVDLLGILAEQTNIPDEFDERNKFLYNQCIKHYKNLGGADV